MMPFESATTELTKPSLWASVSIRKPGSVAARTCVEKRANSRTAIRGLRKVIRTAASRKIRASIRCSKLFMMQRTVAITGGTGGLGTEVVRRLSIDYRCVILGHAQVDLTNEESTRKAFEEIG